MQQAALRVGAQEEWARLEDLMEQESDVHGLVGALVDVHMGQRWQDPSKAADSLKQQIWHGCVLNAWVPQCSDVQTGMKQEI